ncbi:uncharacterized protein LOC110030554 [Phalaenopsis equestris]|uniref:uncharacterized protein LOC110030554 n=1 Tax=Phalaenopsis equestris TaxID=78828 RepID=UPI0009E53B73|nr:uncharacterized protein LOC110030554 [Phalaenopsis equestris]XP_020588978.1 uncharacterized protein LOC110030554 [Phalaenopsis equestris]
MEEGCEGKKIPVAVILLFLLSTVAGALLLIWWSLKFQESKDQLWMVPVSFVFLGSPVVSGFSFFASGHNRDSLQFLYKGPVLASDCKEKILV